MILFLIGTIFGMLLTGLIIKISLHKSKVKDTKEVTKNYTEILDNIKFGESTFNTRINNTVIISTKMKEHGDVKIFYFMDKNDIYIFKGDNCIFTTYLLNDVIKSDIITYINLKHGTNINDVINASGVIMYRKDYEKTYNNILNRVNSDSGQIPTKVVFNIDYILDRISEVGIENLTDEEKKFLKTYKK